MKMLALLLAMAACAGLQAQDLPAASPRSRQAPPGAPRPAPAGRLAQELNLDEMQQHDWRAYRGAHRAELRNAWSEVFAARLKLHQDVVRNDLSAISADDATLGEAVAQVARLRAGELGYLKGILNSDQLGSLQKREEERQTRLQKQLDRFGPLDQ